MAVVGSVVGDIDVEGRSRARYVGEGQGHHRTSGRARLVAPGGRGGPGGSDGAGVGRVWCGEPRVMVMGSW